MIFQRLWFSPQHSHNCSTEPRQLLKTTLGQGRVADTQEAQPGLCVCPISQGHQSKHCLWVSAAALTAVSVLFVKVRGAICMAQRWLGFVSTLPSASDPPFPGRPHTGTLMPAHTAGAWPTLLSQTCCVGIMVCPLHWETPRLPLTGWNEWGSAEVSPFLPAFQA